MPCPESKIRIKAGCSPAVGHGMVPGRAVAFDVSYAVAVATTSIVVIVMLSTDCRGSLMAEALTKAGMLTLEIDGQND